MGSIQLNPGVSRGFRGNILTLLIAWGALPLKNQTLTGEKYFKYIYIYSIHSHARPMSSRQPSQITTGYSRNEYEDFLMDTICFWNSNMFCHLNQLQYRSAIIVVKAIAVQPVQEVMFLHQRGSSLTRTFARLCRRTNRA